MESLLVVLTDGVEEARFASPKVREEGERVNIENIKFRERS